MNTAQPTADLSAFVRAALAGRKPTRRTALDAAGILGRARAEAWLALGRWPTQAESSEMLATIRRALGAAA